MHRRVSSLVFSSSARPPEELQWPRSIP
jgi:hypothetical protein